MKKNDKINFGDREYVLCKNLGEGGNGMVWSAKSVDDTEPVYAVKFLNVSKCDAKKIKRFFNEIEFCSYGSHSNIIKIYAQGVYEDAPCYLMPKYEKTLKDVIESESDYIQIIDYILQICEGIKYIHGLEDPVIHRDIKPENILIDKYNKVVIADFGIAHFIDSTLTNKNDLLCNRNYFAPEQIKGNALKITTACDIYALGMIINELFTKRKPSGSKIMKIFDVNPLLFQLDELVYRCMKQNPEERPDIEDVFSEVTLIKGELLKNLEEIEEYIYIDQTEDIEGDLEEKIAKKASKDILVAKYIFENRSLIEMKFLNTNYHMDIRYCIDDTLKNIYFQNVVYKLCLKKFNAESKSYANGRPYECLNLKHSEHLVIYQKIENVVKRFKVDHRYEDLSGKILKLFSSCCDYHCNEILRSIEREETYLLDFNNSPILYIVYKLKAELPAETIEEINLIDHVYVDWSNTVYDDSVENKLNNDIDDEEIQKIIQIFTSEWNALVTQTDAEHYSIRFKTKNEYNKFKRYALTLSKPYYIFEGDVIDSLKIHREHDGFVELVSWTDFEVTNVLAKILKLRNDY